jgi:hypothetical protein
LFVQILEETSLHALVFSFDFKARNMFFHLCFFFFI